MIAALLLAMAAVPPAAGDSLYGFVRAGATGEPVPGVQVRVGGRTEIAVSDSAGRYRLGGLPAGRLEVRFTRLGFAPLAVSVLLAGGAPARIDVDLTPLPVTLPALSAAPLAALAGHPVADSIVVGRLTVQPSDRNPLLVAGDAFEAVASAPFMNGREELAQTLQVRGGAGDQTLIRVAGLPWHGPRPLGGIAGPMPAGSVARIDVDAAVPPARYGDALSGTIVVYPVAADRFAATGVVDGSMVEQTVRGPLPFLGASLLVSGRWTYRSVFNRPDDGGESENGFTNGIGRLSLPAGRGRLDVYVLQAGNRLGFPAATDSTATVLNHFAATGSLTGAVWTRALAASTIRALVWYERVEGAGAWDLATVTSRRNDAGFSAAIETARAELGLSVARTRALYDVRDTATALALDAAPAVAAAFVSRRWDLLPAATISTGLRTSTLNANGIRFEPRLGVQVAPARAISASLGYSRTYQDVQSARNEESPIDAVLGLDLPVAAGAGGLRPARADQLTGTLAAGFGSAVSLLVEGYTRRLRDVALVAPATQLPFADHAILIGNGSSRGLEATVTARFGRLDVRAQAGVRSALRTSDTISYHPGGDLARGAFGIGYMFTGRSLGRLAVFVGGQRRTTPLADAMQLDPYAPLDGAGALAGTPVTLAGPVNRSRLPLYLRVDLGVNQSWVLSPRGTEARITTSFTVTNLLDRRNVLAFVATPGGQRPIYMLPRTVLVRLRWDLGTN